MINRRYLERGGVQCHFIDTHTHTNTLGSDGDLKPFDQVMYAYNQAYEMFRTNLEENSAEEDFSEEEIRQMFGECTVEWGITDHNTAMAFETLKNETLPKNFVLHTGIELEAVDLKRNLLFDVTVHGIRRDFLKSSLGMHYKTEVVDKKNDLEDESAEIQYEAFRRIGLQLPILLDKEKRYRKTGLRANDVAHDAMHYLLFEETEDSHILEFRQLEDSRRVRKYLLDNGYNPADGRKTYYRKFITNPASDFYVNQTKGRLTLEEILYKAVKENPYSLIMVSHPGSYEPNVPMMQFVREKYEVVQDVIQQLKAEGVDTYRRIGFEVGHRGMTRHQTEKVLAFCLKHNLPYTAESDFHKPGLHKPFRYAYGKRAIDYRVVSAEWFRTPTIEEWF